MLVVHGVWTDGRLVLWAEDDAGPPTTTSRSALRPHPFAAPPPALRAAVQSLIGDPTGPAATDVARTAVAKAEDGELTLQLPSTARGPVPSPESGRSITTAGRTTLTGPRGLRLTAWRVPALVLPPASALALLDVLPVDADTDADVDADAEVLGTLAGTSLRYLAVAGGFARRLVRRGRMLPQFVKENGGYAARWRPVLTAADATAFRDLAAGMPPVCRAAPAEQAAAHVLTAALDGLVDAAVRDGAPERLILGHRPGRTAPEQRHRHSQSAQLLSQGHAGGHCELFFLTF